MIRVLHLGIDYVRAMTDSTWNDYATALATLRAGPLAEAASGFPAARDDWRWAWWRSVGDVDPLPAWKALDRPSLALFGEEDEHDNVPVAASVRRLEGALHPERNARNEIRVYPGLGHTLADSATGWVSATVLDDLTTWILGTVGGIDPATARR